MNRQLKSILSSLPLLTAIVLTPTSFAVGGKNDNAKFYLDYSTTAQDVPTVSTIDAFDANLITTTGGKKYLSVTLVLKGAVDLVGVNCDLSFDKTKLQVVDIHEDQGDINFDGRANIADILTLSERYGQTTTEKGFVYFDRDASDNAKTIDEKDIEVLKKFINQKNIFWTSNPNNDLSTVRESVEIFESPTESNADGKIDDIVSVLLSRIHPYPANFAFTGDARIAQITFEVIGSGEVTFGIEDGKAIDTETVITKDGISKGSEPVSGDTNNLKITLP